MRHHVEGASVTGLSGPILLIPASVIFSQLSTDKVWYYSVKTGFYNTMNGIMFMLMASSGVSSYFK